MSLKSNSLSRLTTLFLMLLALFLTSAVAHAQRRGVYTPGIIAINSGVLARVRTDLFKHFRTLFVRQVGHTLTTGVGEAF
jgi:hypothetical protein